MTWELPRKPDAWLVLDLTEVNGETRPGGNKHSWRVKTQVAVTSEETADPRQGAQQVPCARDDSKDSKVTAD